MTALVPDRFVIDRDGPWLLASRCERCGAYAFPRRQVCPRCKARSTVPARLGRRGRLYSFTVCHVAPEGWSAPYLQAYVELPEGLRVFSLVSSAVEPSSDALSVGMELELVVEPVQPGDPIITFKYRPVSSNA